LPWGKNILYRNKGDGTFEDVTKKAKIDQTNGHYAFSVSTLDYDDDGWPDIYVACDSTPSILYHNNHDGTFTGRGRRRGRRVQRRRKKQQAGMGSTIGDYNGDGRPDIFKTNFSDDTATLYRNNGDGTFGRCDFCGGAGALHKISGMGNGVCGRDNDGWPDLLL